MFQLNLGAPPVQESLPFRPEPIASQLRGCGNGRQIIVSLSGATRSVRPLLVVMRFEGHATPRHNKRLTRQFLPGWLRLNFVEGHNFRSFRQILTVFGSCRAQPKVLLRFFLEVGGTVMRERRKPATDFVLGNDCCRTVVILDGDDND